MADRNQNGQFIKGHRGFKQKGDGQRKILRKLLHENSDELFKHALELANGGDTQLMLFFLKKLVGKEPFSDFKIRGNSALEASESLLAAVGSVDPSILQNASVLLQGHLRVQEAADFEERLAALEAGNANS